MFRCKLLILLFACSSAQANIPQTWESTHFVWNFAMISSADKGIVRNPQAYFASDPAFDKNAYTNLQSGDIVWVKCKFLPEFCAHVLPILEQPIVLLIADGDESFPSNCGKGFDVELLLNHKNIIHVFAQNNDYQGPNTKVSHLPIGTDFHTVAYKNKLGGWGERGSACQQEAYLMNLLKNLKPTHQRKKLAFVDFQLADTMHGEFKRYLQFGEDRKSIFKRLLPTGLIHYGSWMRRHALWATKGEYAFSISPHGNGLDCHRTWEDLILGCIVIVKTSPLDPLYEGLPVIIVKDWDEVTPGNMDIWLAHYGDAFTNPHYREKITNQYWLSKIRAKAQPYKK